MKVSLHDPISPSKLFAKLAEKLTNIWPNHDIYMYAPGDLTDMNSRNSQQFRFIQRAVQQASTYCAAQTEYEHMLACWDASIVQPKSAGTDCVELNALRQQLTPPLPVYVPKPAPNELEIPVVYHFQVLALLDGDCWEPKHIINAIHRVLNTGALQQEYIASFDVIKAAIFESGRLPESENTAAATSCILASIYIMMDLHHHTSAELCATQAFKALLEAAMLPDHYIRKCLPPRDMAGRTSADNQYWPFSIMMERQPTYHVLHMDMAADFQLWQSTLTSFPDPFNITEHIKSVEAAKALRAAATVTAAACAAVTDRAGVKRSRP